MNDSSDPGTLFVAEEGKTGMGPQCGTVTPAVVPAGVTTKVTFLLPPKSVKTCWIWANPVPGQGGSLFQTSDAPMRGKIVFMDGRRRPLGGCLGGTVARLGRMRTPDTSAVALPTVHWINDSLTRRIEMKHSFGRRASPIAAVVMVKAPP